ncbi:branched-chain amino acid ABC transporter permease [Phreatobacter sp.]|uniref:branched-chain amino acid ABC transporter permease n=1 Tax=Phreatobacter sp. TaxID=1966341 RepID=UPI003F71E266
MDTTILLFLLQDGITNGAIYALLGLALVLVFAVTRVIFVPQGEFVAYGGLTFALLEAGRVPGTAYMVVVFGLVAFAAEIVSRRRSLHLPQIGREALAKIALPLAVLAITQVAVAAKAGSLVNLVLTVAIVAPIGPYLYRIAFQPMADASVLVLLITAVGVHLALTGVGLVFFGPEGLRAPPLSDASIPIGPIVATGQSLAIYVITAGLIVALGLFFGRTLTGKALRATAMNRIGARLVGIRLALSGRIAFGLAAVIGAVSGVLIVPMTTLYYDTGFLIGLKGFVAAIIGGLVSYPLTAAAALMVGIIEAFASFHASDWKEVIVFTLLLPVLLIRSWTDPHHDEEE